MHAANATLKEASLAATGMLQAVILLRKRSPDRSQDALVCAVKDTVGTEVPFLTNIPINAPSAGLVMYN